jgi:hypothetical protein
MNTSNIEQSDSKFFSQRAKNISLLNKQSSSIHVKPPPSSDMYFQFSKRTYVSLTEPSLIPLGRGNGSIISNDSRHSIGGGRGRTTVPLSSFVLQKDTLSPPSIANTISSPIFVMHDEVQFVRPYFGPPSNDNVQSSSHKRDVLLSALKEIETNLKTL